eukprot:gene643-biopygen15189
MDEAEGAQMDVWSNQEEPPRSEAPGVFRLPVKEELEYLRCKGGLLPQPSLKGTGHAIWVGTETWPWSETAAKPQSRTALLWQLLLVQVTNISRCGACMDALRTRGSPTIPWFNCSQPTE